MLTDHCNWHLFEADGRRFVQFMLWFHDLPHTDEDVKLGYVVDWDKIENILWEDTDNVRRPRVGHGHCLRGVRFALSLSLGQWHTRAIAQGCAFLDYGENFMPEGELMEIAQIVRRQIKQRDDEREREEVRLPLAFLSPNPTCGRRDLSPWQKGGI